jgi:hypothetical protein
LAPQDAYEDIARNMPALTERAPQLARYLHEFPAGALPHAESYLFWLKTTSTPKPMIQILHTIILASDRSTAAAPAVLVASRQVYATHYVNGWLSLSALMQDPQAPGRRYLAYLSRSHVDGLEGWGGGLMRFFVERRVRERAEELFEAQRRRIESYGSRQGQQPRATAQMPPLHPPASSHESVCR